MAQKQLSVKEGKRLKENFGDWAFITGGSSGIGLELANKLAEAGFNLIISSRSLNVLQQVQSQIQNENGVEVKIIEADVSTEKGIHSIIESTKNLNIGLFIAAAGFGTSGTLIKSDIDVEVNLLNVNCVALLKLTYYFSKLFASQKRGGIILLSSMVAFQGVPFSANYAASKSYVQSLAEALSIELKPYHVHVLAAAPGPVASGFGKRANMKMNLTLQPSEIGIPILKAIGRKTTVFPGLLTKILVYSLRSLPRSGKIRVMGKVMNGFVKHQTTL